MQTTTVNALDQNTYRTTNDDGLFSQPKAKNDSLGRDAFMKLLVKQMENQDPLEPVKDQEYVAQLAQFSSLEQLTQLNTSMNNMISGQQQLVNSQSLTLIGRSVIADTDSVVRLDASGAQPINAQFDTVPANARVEIYDEKGLLVRTMNIAEPKTGLNKVQWDGKSDKGVVEPAGDYTFKVVQTDASGKASTAPGFVTMKVDGIRVTAAGVQLVSGDRAVNFSKVIEIRLADTPASNTTSGATGPLTALTR